MQLNIYKSKIIVFRNAGTIRQIEEVLQEAGNRSSERISIFRCFFTPKLTWSRTKEALSQQTTKAVNTINRYSKYFGHFDHFEVFKLFGAMVRPILIYSSQIWGYQYSKVIENVHVNVSSVSKSSPTFLPSANVDAYHCQSFTCLLC